MCFACRRHFVAAVSDRRFGGSAEFSVTLCFIFYPVYPTILSLFLSCELVPERSYCDLMDGETHGTVETIDELQGPAGAGGPADHGRRRHRQVTRRAISSAPPRRRTWTGSARTPSTPSSRRTASPSACRATRTWATARSATTPSAAAACSTRAPAWSTRPSRPASLFEGETWKELVSNCSQHDSALHFIGLFSDGNVHSHINHLEAMLHGGQGRRREEGARPSPARRPRCAAAVGAGLRGPARGLSQGAQRRTARWTTPSPPAAAA